MQRIASLDGVRALAITMVIGGHLVSHEDGRFRLLDIVFGGQDGVGLFFVLSGFLVTSLLLREHEQSGTVDIPHFYFRRGLRIVPPLLAYLLVVICLEWWMGDPIAGLDIASVIFFFHNMTHGGNWMLEHTWSLAVEEQYYLLWPLVFVLALRGSWRTLIRTTLALIMLAPVIRLSGHWMQIAWMHRQESYLLPTRMDALLAGSLMACLAGTRRFESLYRRLARFYWVAPVFLFVISPSLDRWFWFEYDYSIGYTMNALVSAFFILWLSRNGEHLLGRIANWKPIAMVGVMSYSTYLWQTLGTHYADRRHGLMLGLLFIVAMTSLSFYGVERPAAWARSVLEKKFFRDKMLARVTAREQEEAAVVA